MCSVCIPQPAVFVRLSPMYTVGSLFPRWGTTPRFSQKKKIEFSTIKCEHISQAIDVGLV